jgi:hypothetical protein
MSPESDEATSNPTPRPCEPAEDFDPDLLPTQWGPLMFRCGRLTFEELLWSTGITCFGGYMAYDGITSSMVISKYAGILCGSGVALAGLGIFFKLIKSGDLSFHRVGTRDS